MNNNSNIIIKIKIFIKMYNEMSFLFNKTIKSNKLVVVVSVSTNLATNSIDNSRCSGFLSDSFNKKIK